jgi:diguanylate cyclase (GGDEF)-like protein/PAS domain S-box-containing protein
MSEHKTTRVLIVEDDSLVCEMLQGILEDMEYVVVGRAADGYQAIELTQKLKPDVILMDIQLPNMDGIEATRRIFNSAPTPIVALTAYDSADVLERVRAAGFGAYLTKPPDARQIDRAISITIARFEDLMTLRKLNDQLKKDIIRRKSAEAKLRQAEQKYRQLVEHINAVVYIDKVDDTSTSIYTSPQTQRIFGYASEQWIEDAELWLNMIHPEDRERVQAEHIRTNKSGAPFLMEYRVITADGRVIWIHDDARLIYDEISKEKVWHGMMYDITDRKQAEAELQQAHARLEQYSHQLAQILETSNSLKINLTLESLLEEIIKAATKSLGFRIAILSLPDENTKQVRVRKFTGLDEEGKRKLAEAVYTPEQIARFLQPRFKTYGCYFIPCDEIDLAHEDIGPFYISDRSDVVQNLANDDWHPEDFLIVPIEFKKDEWGMGFLSLDQPINGKRPTQEMLQTLAIFSNQVSVAIENAYLYEQAQHELTERKQTEVKLRYLSTHDGLTGLYNRFYYEDECQRLERGRQFPISIMMVDVDGMKKINDTQGHAAGDELLRATASVLKSAFRDEDVVARIGGDEFAIILPKTDAATANQTLERIKLCLKEYNDSLPENPLSLSIGVATGEKGASLAKLLKQADESMYEVKMYLKGLSGS